MIDAPLYDNPLAGGGGQLGGATFRQEGDMGRYVAFNDPGQPGAGFSSLEEYLAAGNKLPEQQTPNDLLGVSNANFNVSPPGTLNVTPMNPFLGQIDTPEQLIESGQFTPGVGQDIFGNNPMEIAVPSNPYNRGGQQLTGPNQDDILGTLKNIEQGIASLGQGNMDQSSFSGFNNNFGIGSFFPPYGGMYGK